MYSDEPYKVGDLVLIKNGSAMCRSDNPHGKITVRILRIRRDKRAFKASSEHNDKDFIYHFDEIIERRDELFVFR